MISDSSKESENTTNIEFDKKSNKEKQELMVGHEKVAVIKRFRTEHNDAAIDPSAEEIQGIYSDKTKKEDQTFGPSIDDTHSMCLAETKNCAQESELDSKKAVNATVLSLDIPTNKSATSTKETENQKMRLSDYLEYLEQIKSQKRTHNSLEQHNTNKNNEHGIMEADKSVSDDAYDKEKMDLDVNTKQGTLKPCNDIEYRAGLENASTKEHLSLDNQINEVDVIRIVCNGQPNAEVSQISNERLFEIETPEPENSNEAINQVEEFESICDNIDIPTNTVVCTEIKDQNQKRNTDIPNTYPAVEILESDKCLKKTQTPDIGAESNALDLQQNNCVRKDLNTLRDSTLQLKDNFLGGNATNDNKDKNVAHMQHFYSLVNADEPNKMSQQHLFTETNITNKQYNTSKPAVYGLQSDKTCKNSPSSDNITNPINTTLLNAEHAHNLIDQSKLILKVNSYKLLQSEYKIKLQINNNIKDALYPFDTPATSKPANEPNTFSKNKRDAPFYFYEENNQYENIFAYENNHLPFNPPKLNTTPRHKLQPSKFDSFIKKRKNLRITNDSEPDYFRFFSRTLKTTRVPNRRRVAKSEIAADIESMQRTFSYKKGLVQYCEETAKYYDAEENEFYTQYHDHLYNQNQAFNEILDPVMTKKQKNDFKGGFDANSKYAPNSIPQKSKSIPSKKALDYNLRDFGDYGMYQNDVLSLSYQSVDGNKGYNTYGDDYIFDYDNQYINPQEILRDTFEEVGMQNTAINKEEFYNLSSIESDAYLYNRTNYQENRDKKVRGSYVRAQGRRNVEDQIFRFSDSSHVSDTPKRHSAHGSDTQAVIHGSDTPMRHSAHAELRYNEDSHFYSTAEEHNTEYNNVYGNVITNNFTIEGEVFPQQMYGATDSTCNSLFVNRNGNDQQRYNKTNVCLYPGCNNVYSSVTAMRFHLKLKHGLIYKEEKPIKCRVEGCEKTFKSRGGLVYHKKHSH